MNPELQPLELRAWLCPVCGLKRNIGNHAKCSKITQQKHQQERVLKAEEVRK
jgi:hypothetical protein